MARISNAVLSNNGQSKQFVLGWVLGERQIFHVKDDVTCGFGTYSLYDIEISFIHILLLRDLHQELALNLAKCFLHLHHMDFVFPFISMAYVS